MSDNTVSFENAQIGVTPEGWTATLTGKGDPKWTVEKDETAPSKQKVLKQSGRATYPLLLKNDTNIKDGFIEVKFKAIAGSQDRAGGVVWRAKDANNYYVTRANALEDNVVLYKTVNGVRSPLDIVGRKGGYGIEVPVPANTWHSLRVDFKGSRFSVSFNGKQVFEVEDSTFTDAGKVGLWTKADSVTLFDEVARDLINWSARNAPAIPATHSLSDIALSPRRGQTRKSPARDDYRQPGNQEKREHDFAECDLIKFAVKGPTEQSAGDKHGQTDQKKPGRFPRYQPHPAEGQ